MINDPVTIPGLDNTHVAANLDAAVDLTSNHHEPMTPRDRRTAGRRTVGQGR